MSKQSKASPQRSDHETRVTEDHHESLRLWLRMLACTNLIEAHVRSQLRVKFQTTLPRFDLMSQLERNPDGLKMGELSRRMMVTGGNVTGITDQLVSEGLVVREDNPKDRRAYIVKLTKEGRRVFREWADDHEDWIIRLFEGLGEKERGQLYALLAQLKQHVASASEGS